MAGTTIHRLQGVLRIAGSALAGLILLAGCTTTGQTSGPGAPAPSRAESDSRPGKTQGIAGAYPAQARVTTPAGSRRLKPGDRLRIRMADFVAEGTVSEFSPVVSEAGEIDLPQLGTFQVKGLTIPELIEAIIDRAPRTLVYPIDAVPTPDIQLDAP